MNANVLQNFGIDVLEKNFGQCVIEHGNATYSHPNFIIRTSCYPLFLYAHQAGSYGWHSIVFSAREQSLYMRFYLQDGTYYKESNNIFSTERITWNNNSISFTTSDGINSNGFNYVVLGIPNS